MISEGCIDVVNLRDEIMNWDIIKGNWKQYQGKARENWGELTDDDVAKAEGNREQLVGRIQERYGITKDEADKQIKEWEAQLS